MKITATDADEAGNQNSKISYSIVQESHANMFYINRETGWIHVMQNTLDREVYCHQHEFRLLNRLAYRLIQNWFCSSFQT